MMEYTTYDERNRTRGVGTFGMVELTAAVIFVFVIKIIGRFR